MGHPWDKWPPHVTLSEEESHVGCPTGAYRDDAQRYFRLARAVLGNEEQAWDAVQDAFTQALRKRATYRGEAPIEAWLWQIVLNEARQRTHDRSIGMPLDGDQPSLEGVDRGNDELRSAFARLTERQRLVLFLRYYADLDYGQISDVLGIATGTIGPTLAQAQLRLRTILGEER